MAEVPAYDPRYLAGIVRFNRGEFFDAHEVWEDLWMECPAAERRFVQSLIQAAVALYHHERGNRTGADRLFQSGRRYMQPYSPRYFGLDVAKFWADMEEAFAGGRPAIALDPPPEQWPDPDEIHHE